MSKTSIDSEAVANNINNTSTPSNKSRVHISLPQSIYDKLDEAKRKTHAETLSEVVRNAIMLYLALVNERIEGNDVIVRSRDGQETKYSVFLD